MVENLMKNRSMKRLIDTNCSSSGEHKSNRLPSVSYNKLVVPLRMRSIYWKYFGFPANEDKQIITKDIIVCLLCRHQMIYNRNTSNLRTHLKSRHKNVISKLDGDSGSNSQTTSKTKLKKELQMNSSTGEIDFSDITVLDVNSISSRNMREVSTMVVSDEGNEGELSNISIIFPTQEEMDYNSSRQGVNVLQESTDLNDSIMNFIITDLISPDIVQGSGFHRLLSAFSPKAISIPDEKKLSAELIPTMYATQKKQLHHSITSGGLTNLSLSIEEFQCLDGPKCFSVYAHYIKTAEASIQTKLLSTLSASAIEDFGGWISVLDKVFHDWNINLGAVSAVIMGSNSSELQTFFNLKGVRILLPCFLFVLQDLCTNKIFEFHTVKDLLKRCKETVKLVLEEQIEEDTKFDYEDVNAEALPAIFGFNQNSLWLTTFFMLQGLLQRKQRIAENPSATDKCPLNATHWKNLSDLVEFLEPLKTIVVSVLEEKNSIISLLYPLIMKLTESSLTPESTDTTIIKKIKEITKNHLDEAYDKDNVQQFMQMATLLDPRFKSFTFQSMKLNESSLLTAALTDLVQNDGLIDIEVVQDSPTKKSNRLSGINALLGNFQAKKNSATVEEKIRNEISFYETTEVPLNECPLEWWQNSRNRCPNLIRLAHKYLCVPVSIDFCGQKDVSEYLKFYNKRTALRVNTLDMLLFLHLN